MQGCVLSNTHTEFLLPVSPPITRTTTTTSLHPHPALFVLHLLTPPSSGLTPVTPPHIGLCWPRYPGSTTTNTPRYSFIAPSSFFFFFCSSYHRLLWHIYLCILKISVSATPLEAPWEQGPLLPILLSISEVATGLAGCRCSADACFRKWRMWTKTCVQPGRGWFLHGSEKPPTTPTVLLQGKAVWWIVFWFTPSIPPS